MKKILFFCILLFTISLQGKVNAQPTRQWSTYYGNYTQFASTYTPSPYFSHFVYGTVVYDIKYDKKHGYIYLAGETTDTTGIASPGSFKSHFQPTFLGVFYGYNFFGANAFLAKFDTLGHRIWATYYGGNWDIYQPSIALGKQGDVYLTGLTSSNSGIATPGSHQSTFTGFVDPQNPYRSTYLPFLIKFNSNGQRIWGTYFGQYGYANTGAGALSSVGMAIACDTLNGYIYIAGRTSDTSGIATPGSFEDQYTSDSLHPEAYIAKFNTNGIFKWGTYYGGSTLNNNMSGGTAFYSLWVGRKGDLYALGSTNSDSGIATSGATETYAPNGGGFLVKFDSSGSRLWATYVGHHLDILDILPLTIAGYVDPEGFDNIYLLEYIQSNPSVGLVTTPNAYQTSFGGGQTDLLLMKYGEDGTMMWSTLFGGNGDEPPLQIAEKELGAHLLSADNRGNLYLVSLTTSTQGIQHACQPMLSSHQRSITAKWTPDGDLLWSSYADADLEAVCAGSGGSFYIGGYTTYDSLATPGSHQPTKVSNRPSGFFAKLSSECPYISIPVSENQNLLSVGDSFDSYQWYKNGGGISGADSNVYEVPSGDSGNYFVTVTRSCGCSYHSDTVDYHTTGINKMNQNGWNLHLFPNPATGVVTFSLDLKQPGNVAVSISDLVGRQLLKKVYGVLSGSQKKELNVSSLPQSLYFVQFEIGGQRVVRKLEVK